MARTHRHGAAFRKGRGDNRIVAPIHSPAWLRFDHRGRPFCVDGSEAWGRRHKRWAKRQASRLRRRHFTQEDRMTKQDALTMLGDADIVTETVRDQLEALDLLNEDGEVTDEQANDLIDWFANMLTDES